MGPVVRNPICSSYLTNLGNFPFIAWNVVVPNISNVRRFDLYRAVGGATKEATWEKVGFSNLNFFLDQSFRITPMNPVGYKVNWVDEDDNEGELTDAEIARPDTAPIPGIRGALKYIRMEQIRKMGWLGELVGEQVYFFVRNLVGETCECSEADDITGRGSTKSDCTVCFNSGIVPGWSVFKGWMGFQTAPESISVESKGLTIAKTTRGRIGIYPALKEMDFVRRQDGTLGQIGDIIKGEPLNTEQDFQWKEVIDHILYLFPVEEATILDVPTR